MENECTCGAIIVDEGVDLPHKGYLISDADYGALLASSLAEFQAFLAAATPEARDQWMTKHFGLQWRRDLTDAQHLEAFIHGQMMDHSRMVYECPECGRLLIDEKSSDVIHLVEFTPLWGQQRLLASRVSRL